MTDYYITYVGCADDVFKASDYRISPFELESVQLEHLAPYERIRRIEFSDLPKTISGKIRRVQLRAVEAERRQKNERAEWEFFEEDFPELKA